MANRIAPLLTLLSRAGWTLWLPGMPEGMTEQEVWDRATKELRALLAVAKHYAALHALGPVHAGLPCKSCDLLARLSRASLSPPSTVEGKHKLRANSGRGRR
jgi:hypothetical protein